MGFLKWLWPALALGGLHAKTLLILPLAGDTSKVADFATIDGLYRDALQGAFRGDATLLPVDSADGCAEKACALRLASAARADEVAFASLHRLGSKWILSGTVVDARSREAFHQRMSALGLEDMDAVTRRMAEALMSRRTVEEAAKVDNITAKEAVETPARRRSLYTAGFSLGYLIPTDGSYSYLKTGFAEMECPCTLEQPYSQMVRLSWINAWEFRKNLRLDWEGNWALPNVVGTDLNLQYLFSTTDFSPFAGGGLGIEYVGSLDDVKSDTRRNSGPSLNVQGGMVFFRTYDVQVTARAQYKLVLDTDADNGFAYDMAVTFRPLERRAQRGFWGSFWGYYIIGALVVGLIGTMSD